MTGVVFALVRPDTHYPALWFVPPGKPVPKRVDHVLLAKQLLNVPRAKGHG
jgi:hypothetical protein